MTTTGFSHSDRTLKRLIEIFIQLRNICHERGETRTIGRKTGTILGDTASWKKILILKISHLQN